MKIGVVGAGQVGATAAYSMMMRRVGSEIMLVDRNADLAVAQARRHCWTLRPLPIRSRVHLARELFTLIMQRQKEINTTQIAA